MADKEKKPKKKEKSTVVLPKVWQSIKHKNETSQAKTNLDDMWSVLGVVLTIGIVLFIILGGASQRGILQFISNWSQEVGTDIADWLNKGEVITNEDGVYWAPDKE